MTNFCLINEADWSATELATTAAAMLEYGNVDLAPWKFGTVTCTVGNLQAGDVPVYITTRARKRGASAYHDKDANGHPFIYVLPGQAFNRMGFYVAPQPSRKIGLFTRPARKEMIQPGPLTSLIHEVAEVLGDPLVNTEAAPDALGHNLLREITDPVFGINYMKMIAGKPCIFPDSVLPNWYVLGSSGPWDISFWCRSAFQKTPKGYAYYVKVVGNIKRFFKV